jgi:DNA-binding winged helix-turn-helix (wHTH) protein
MRFLFDNHVLDLGQRELRLGAEPVALEPRVFDKLAYMVANRDHVDSKDDLQDAVWSGRIVSESAIWSCIAAARRAFGDSG